SERVYVFIPRMSSEFVVHSSWTENGKERTEDQTITAIEQTDITWITFARDEVISYDPVVLWSLFATDASGRIRQSATRS
ncbi:MAG: hypothetical protein QOF35_1090, partial [Actinomycetota bacterium]|nr:hypothetical protein [Actinomycetota bacterium]